MRITYNGDPALDRVFNRVMRSTTRNAASRKPFTPAVEVRTNGDEQLVVVDVPGVSRDGLEITCERGVLTIQGSRTFDAPDGEQIALGRAYGSFRQSIKLPRHVDGSRASAELADGVLTVRIPKEGKVAMKKVYIAVSDKAPEAETAA